jgi:branched-chain amino acid transport system substrate-binding protein
MDTIKMRRLKEMKASKLNTPLKSKISAAIVLFGIGTAGAAQADLTVGVILSLTGPAASLGKPAENTVRIWPEQIGSQKVRLVVLNDNSDATEAAKQASKLITEEKVDVIVGPSITPPSIAAMEVAGRNATPIIALGGGNAIVEPQEVPVNGLSKWPRPNRFRWTRRLGI